MSDPPSQTPGVPNMSGSEPRPNAGPATQPTPMHHAPQPHGGNPLRERLLPPTQQPPAYNPAHQLPPSFQPQQATLDQNGRPLP